MYSIVLLLQLEIEFSEWQSFPRTNWYAIKIVAYDMTEYAVVTLQIRCISIGSH